MDEGLVQSGLPQTYIHAGESAGGVPPVRLVGPEETFGAYGVNGTTVGATAGPRDRGMGAGRWTRDRGTGTGAGRGHTGAVAAVIFWARRVASLGGGGPGWGVAEGGPVWAAAQ